VLLSRSMPDPTEIRATSDHALALQITRATPGHAVDEEAELYRRFARRVRMYGLRHLRDAQAAEDLVQDALLLVIQKLRAGEVRDHEQLASFILGTCRMLARNKIRGEARRRAILDRFEIPAGVFESPAGAGLDASRLAECMQTLSERARTVTVLTFYADRSAAEIAEEMWISANNVRVMRHRALAALQQCMEVS
jgi:RNA polymerase sigma-70 factor (ECF subfamily)